MAMLHYERDIINLKKRFVLVVVEIRLVLEMRQRGKITNCTIYHNGNNMKIQDKLKSFA